MELLLQSKAGKTASKKAKKGGIKKGTAKTLPDESQKTSATGTGKLHLHRLHLFRQADTKTEPIREAEPDLAARSLFR